jgi:HEAT repeat protein
MKRLFVALGVVVLLSSTAFLVFFTASKYRVKKQSYLQSLSDFVFMLHSYNIQIVGLDPAPLTESRYERVMGHARRTAHNEVRRRVVWSLKRWDEEVVPLLVREIELPKSDGRIIVAADALGQMQVRSFLPLFEMALERFSENRYLVVRLIDAIGHIGPEAAPLLTATYRRYERAGKVIPYNLLGSIGQSGGGVDFLIEEMLRAESPERIRELQWPLAFTQDPRAAEILVGQLHHPNLGVRRRARDSMSQSMGPAAVAPAVALLETETDDYLRMWIINSILASRNARGSPEAVRLLGRLLDDPAMAWEANYALARIANEEAIELLASRMRRYSPRWVMDNLEYSGAGALRIFEEYLRDPEPAVRRAALYKIQELDMVEAIPALEAVRSDPDPRTRALAEGVLFRADLLLLGESFREWLSEVTGKPAGHARLPDRKGVRSALGTLAVLNWIGLGISLVLGLLMLAGWLRTFEHYKFALVIQFLLVSGIVFDFFLVSEPYLYRGATAGRLLLLLGLLFLRDDPLPGETRGRIERLVVRSLWVLVPLLLIFGVPLFAEALRVALRDFDFMKWVLVLLLVLTVLILEQAVMPWDLFPRGGRTERAFTFCFSTAVVAIFAGAVWQWVDRSASEDADRATLGGIFLLPLLVAVLFHFKESRLLSPRGEPLRFPPPPGRMRATFDSESVRIRMKERRRLGLRHLFFVASMLLAMWWIAQTLEVVRAGGPGMFLLMVIVIFGTAVASLLLTGLGSGFTLQVRADGIRSARTFLGGAFGATPWYRKLRLPVLARQLDVTGAEKRWITEVLGRTTSKAEPQLAMSARLATRGEDEPIGMILRVENQGAESMCLADIEAEHGVPWIVEVDGRQCHLSFTRAEREADIGPGRSVTFHPRLHAKGPVRSSSLVFRCGTTVLKAALVWLFVFTLPALATIEAEHPSDYVRVLESPQPELWGEAVRGLLGEDEDLPKLAVSSVLRRLPELERSLQVRLSRTLVDEAWHPSTLPTLLELAESDDDALREVATESLLSLRSPGAMDVFRDFILDESPHRVEALRSLCRTYEHWVDTLSEPLGFGIQFDPVMDPANGSPEKIFDRDYLPVVRTLLQSPDSEIRGAALGITSALDTSGLREEWVLMLEDPDASIRWDAQWELAERGDPRPCLALFEHAEEVARTWTDAYERYHRLGKVGASCAATYYLDYFSKLRQAQDETSRLLYREMIAGATGLELLEYPSIIEGLQPLADDPDPLIREAARRVLEWREEKKAEERAELIQGGIQPIVLIGLAAIAGLVGALLFVWSFRLYLLAVRVRNRPIAKARSVAMGPVALEGEAQPFGDYLRHPITEEPCVYYAGADAEHPKARFYLEDETGRILIDPRRAVLFSDDGVIVAGEKVHLVGFAHREGREGRIVVTKDPARPPLHSRFTNRLIEILFGFGRKTSVTKMLFSDPTRCFWIWDDLERRPMGEARDVGWLAASTLLGGAWIIVFAIAVLTLIDQEMSARLARAVDALNLFGPL